MAKLRERRKSETYKLILESARSLFNELGFEKTTMRLVATKAEIGLGTTYKYFSKKNGLLAAAFYDDLNMITEKALETLSETLPIKEKLLHIAGQYYTFYAERPALSRTYLTQLSKLDPPWLKRILDLDSTYLERVSQLIDQSKHSGEVKADVDSHLSANAFHSHYLYVLAENAALNHFVPETMLQSLGDLLDLLLMGIST